MTDIRFRLLGPLRMWRGETEVKIGSDKQRAVLALLLLRAGSPVRRQEIIDTLWGDDTPESVVNLVQTYVGRLRRQIDPGKGAYSASTWLAGMGTAYVVRLDRCDVDLVRFRAGVAGARSAASPEESLALLLSALRMWNGPCLADLDHVLRGHPWVRAIEHERIDTLLEAAKTAQRLGRSADVIPQLRAVAAAEPLNEAVHTSLVLALAASGMQAEALAEYGLIRLRLAEELGVDPGSQLRDAYFQVLRQETRYEGAGVAEPPCPSLLPADIADFTGREKLVEQLGALIADRRPGPIPVSTITGRAGVGKTTLAVHLAHRMSGDFPGGQLYADLRGSAEQPADPSRVLTRFLRSLGIGGQAIPEDADERAELYRTQLAGRRVLVVLDDAADQAQVRPLLPGSPSCSVIVTSRSRMAGWPGAHAVDLDLLEPHHAGDLLAVIVGAERVAPEPEAATELVRLCGRLPLAIRAAATRLAARPHWTLARMAGRMADERHGLDELSDVRATLALGYRRLDEPAQRALRLLGLLDLPTFAPWLVAGVLEASTESAEDLIDALADAYFLDTAGVDAVGQPRYRFHELVRRYARELALREESEATVRTVVIRALAILLALAQDADGRLPYTVRAPLYGRSPRWPPPADVREPLLADPLAWFDSERPCLVAAVLQASGLGHDELAWELAAATLNAAIIRTPWAEIGATHRSALLACRATGNRRGEAVMLRGLGELDHHLGRRQECLDTLNRARVLFAEIRDAPGEADTAARLDVLRARTAQAT
ncbi:DNA-binding transcriptional activator of the SARP family [Streptosporangium canum]|uniref:DNA-binding transcriptional activator of the SARP family n=2 Tax=Streptosporangium canum TaxID=324952 RepID=A0A1I3K3R8_9ACTN|nr:DNA-binding transcriptional activator of the SARP family [Streptosporangium canum]